MKRTCFLICIAAIAATAFVKPRRAEAFLTEQLVVLSFTGIPLAIGGAAAYGCCKLFKAGRSYGHKKQHQQWAMAKRILNSYDPARHDEFVAYINGPMRNKLGKQQREWLIAKLEERRAMYAM